MRSPMVRPRRPLRLGNLSPRCGVHFWPGHFRGIQPQQRLDAGGTSASACDGGIQLVSGSKRGDNLFRLVSFFMSFSRPFFSNGTLQLSRAISSPTDPLCLSSDYPVLATDAGILTNLATTSQRQITATDAVTRLL